MTDPFGAAALPLPPPSPSRALGPADQARPPPSASPTSGSPSPWQPTLLPPITAGLTPNSAAHAAAHQDVVDSMVQDALDQSTVPTPTAPAAGSDADSLGFGTSRQTSLGTIEHPAGFTSAPPSAQNRSLQGSQVGDLLNMELDLLQEPAPSRVLQPTSVAPSPVAATAAVTTTTSATNAYAGPASLLDLMDFGDTTAAWASAPMASTGTAPAVVGGGPTGSPMALLSPVPALRPMTPASAVLPGARPSSAAASPLAPVATAPGSAASRPNLPSPSVLDAVGELLSSDADRASPAPAAPPIVQPRTGDLLMAFADESAPASSHSPEDRSFDPSGPATADQTMFLLVDGEPIVPPADATHSRPHTSSGAEASRSAMAAGIDLAMAHLTRSGTDVARIDTAAAATTAPPTTSAVTARLPIYSPSGLVDAEAGDISRMNLLDHAMDSSVASTSAAPSSTGGMPIPIATQDAGEAVMPSARHDPPADDSGIEPATALDSPMGAHADVASPNSPVPSTEEVPSADTGTSGAAAEAAVPADAANAVDAVDAVAPSDGVEETKPAAPPISTIQPNVALGRDGASSMLSNGMFSSDAAHHPSDLPALWETAPCSSPTGVSHALFSDDVSRLSPVERRKPAAADPPAADSAAAANVSRLFPTPRDGVSPGTTTPISAAAPSAAAPSSPTPPASSSPAVTDARAEMASPLDVSQAAGVDETASPAPSPSRDVTGEMATGGMPRALSSGPPSLAAVASPMPSPSSGTQGPSETMPSAADAAVRTDLAVDGAAPASGLLAGRSPSPLPPPPPQTQSFLFDHTLRDNGDSAARPKSVGCDSMASDLFVEAPEALETDLDARSSLEGATAGHATARINPLPAVAHEDSEDEDDDDWEFHAASEPPTTAMAAVSSSGVPAAAPSHRVVGPGSAASSTRLFVSPSEGPHADTPNPPAAVATATSSPHHAAGAAPISPPVTMTTAAAPTPISVAPLSDPVLDVSSMVTPTPCVDDLPSPSPATATTLMPAAPAGMNPREPGSFPQDPLASPGPQSASSPPPAAKTASTAAATPARSASPPTSAETPDLPETQPVGAYDFMSETSASTRFAPLSLAATRSVEDSAPTDAPGRGDAGADSGDIGEADADADINADAQPGAEADTGARTPAAINDADASHDADGDVEDDLPTPPTPHPAPGSALPSTAAPEAMGEPVAPVSNTTADFDDDDFGDFNGSVVASADTTAGPPSEAAPSPHVPPSAGTASPFLAPPPSLRHANRPPLLATLQLKTPPRAAPWSSVPTDDDDDDFGDFTASSAPIDGSGRPTAPLAGMPPPPQAFQAASAHPRDADASRAFPPLPNSGAAGPLSAPVLLPPTLPAAVRRHLERGFTLSGARRALAAELFGPRDAKRGDALDATSDASDDEHENGEWAQWPSDADAGAEAPLPPSTGDAILAALPQRAETPFNSDSAVTAPSAVADAWTAWADQMVAPWDADLPILEVAAATRGAAKAAAMLRYALWTTSVAQSQFMDVLQTIQQLQAQTAAKAAAASPVVTPIGSPAPSRDRRKVRLAGSWTPSASVNGSTASLAASETAASVQGRDSRGAAPRNAPPTALDEGRWDAQLAEARQLVSLPPAELTAMDDEELEAFIASLEASIHAMTRQADYWMEAQENLAADAAMYNQMIGSLVQYAQQQQQQQMKPGKRGSPLRTLKK
ncbi:hypothetical protein CXG81DRAFT_28230 [Caulochytrium protostelioides]|uniref:Uncharacterized protein n=1 Tax=Caulochytrium protostelioides TaxID=1555241 RepID=A0A4P9X1Y8_9FUNG|nr:hypothetical protein CXG81DRAFT_28230 [Caulochytrium protostelioides]|eukprot:RKO98988.1 hypothetical protein CXG81DRAFT_28230 [Caulochytrium protostelioides]